MGSMTTNKLDGLTGAVLDLFCGGVSHRFADSYYQFADPHPPPLLPKNICNHPSATPDGKILFLADTRPLLNMKTKEVQHLHFGHHTLIWCSCYQHLSEKQGQQIGIFTYQQ